MDVDPSSGFLSLLTNAGETKDDVSLNRLPGEGSEGMPVGLGPRSDDDKKSFDDLSVSLIQRFEEGENLKVTVHTLMGRDYLIKVVRDLDA